MKAIYINIDRYLQAVADWLNAGHPGDAPKFSPLPVAVTIPAGQTACIYCPSAGEAETDPIDAPNSDTIDGMTLYFAQTADDGIPVDAIAVKVAPGLSALAPSAKYWVEGVTGNTSATFYVTDGDVLGDAPIYFTIPVLVQFEKSSGVVDLVDFTPPASGAPSAADIKSALVAAGEGALAGVKLDGAILVTMEDGMHPDEATQIGEAGPLIRGADLETQLGVGSASA
jgi:hypothetical protein